MNGGCAFALKGKNMKPASMIDAQFAKKDEIFQPYLFFALDDQILFNVQTVNITFKVL